MKHQYFLPIILLHYITVSSQRIIQPYSKVVSSKALTKVLMRQFEDIAVAGWAVANYLGKTNH